MAEAGLCALVGLLVCLHFWREAYWRRREEEYINRLLKQGGVQPIAVQREKVIKVPDVDSTPIAETWVDVAMRRDAIKEELEQMYPEAARVSQETAQQQWPREWRAIESRLVEEETPLRVS